MSRISPEIEQWLKARGMDTPAEARGEVCDITHRIFAENKDPLIVGGVVSVTLNDNAFRWPWNVPCAHASEMAAMAIFKVERCGELVRVSELYGWEQIFLYSELIQVVEKYGKISDFERFAGLGELQEIPLSRWREATEGGAE